MRRRQFLTTLGVAAACVPLDVLAQAPARRSLIVWFGLGTPIYAEKYQGILRDGLAELGYVDGRNIEITGRFADFKADRLPLVADEVVRLGPALIVTSSSDTALAAKRATTAIPIVSGALADAEQLGLVESYARPGGNVTGIMPYIAGLPSKQIELAREIVPAARRIGLLGNLNDPKVGPQMAEMKGLAQTLGLAVTAPEVSAPESIEGAVQEIVRERADVAIVLESTLLLNFRKPIATAMAANRLPAVYGYRDHVEEGGLISYGVDLRWCWHRTATFVQKILNGARPAELPVEFPPKIQMLVNLKTAKGLGLTLSTAVLGRADEVIE